MKSRRDMLANLVELAELVAPLVGPGGAAAVAAAKKVMDMIDGTAGEGDTAAIEARDALEKRVNGLVDDTIDRLRG